MFRIRFIFICQVHNSICSSLMMKSVVPCFPPSQSVLYTALLCWVFGFVLNRKRVGAIKVDKSYLFLGRYFQSWYCFPSLCVLSPGAPQWGSGTTKEQWVRAGLINTTEVLPGAWHNRGATISLPRESRGIYSRLSADWALNDNLPHYQLCLLT